MSRCLQLGRSGSSVVSRWLNSSEASIIFCIHILIQCIWELTVDLALLQDRTTKSIDHEGMNTASGSRFGAHDGFAELKDFLSIRDQDFHEDTKGSSDSRCLHEMLEESQSDSPVSFYSHLDSSEESDSEVNIPSSSMQSFIANYSGLGTYYYNYHFQQNLISVFVVPHLPAVQFYLQRFVVTQVKSANDWRYMPMLTC